MHRDFTLEAYKTALATRNLEISLFWQRSNYFLVLNTAIAVGFFSRPEHDYYAVGLSLIGVVVATLWVRVNLGSKFWQSRWERRLEVVEAELDGPFRRLFAADLNTVRADVRESLNYDRPEKGWLEALYESAVMRKPSVSKTMTMLSAFFVLVWLAAAGLSGYEAFRSDRGEACSTLRHGVAVGPCFHVRHSH